MTIAGVALCLVPGCRDESGTEPESSLRFSVHCASVSEPVSSRAEPHCGFIYYGGEMWRPLVDVRDAARAYIAALRADDKPVVQTIDQWASLDGPIEPPASR